jgi:hypothetical protein
MTRCVGILLLCTIFAVPSFAQEASVTERVARLAQESCTVSAIQGSRRTSEGGRVVTLPGTTEEIQISQDRWNGIQQVLREHQQQDSANYRDCVRDLTRTFIEAEREMQQQAAVPTVPPVQNGLTCPYENDGFCDVPGDCPYGTDLNDCAAQPQQPVTSPWPGQPQPSVLYCCDYLIGQKWCVITWGQVGAGLPCTCDGISGSGYQCY